MKIIRKNHVLIIHTCVEQEKEIQQLKAALTFTMPLAEINTKNQQHLQTLLEALNKAEIENSKIILKYPIEKLIGNHTDRILCDQNLCLALCSLSAEMWKYKAELCDEKIAGEPIDIEFENQLNQAIHYITNLKKSIA